MVAALRANPCSAQAPLLGQNILWDCADLPAKATIEESFAFSACVAYLQGASDMLTLVISFTAPGKYCPPDRGISNDQARRIVRKWIMSNPEEMSAAARGVVFTALMRAFPCAKARGP